MIESNADALFLRAAVGITVHLGAVAIRLRRIANAISNLRTIQVGDAVVPNLRLTGEAEEDEGEGKETRNQRSIHGWAHRSGHGAGEHPEIWMNFTPAGPPTSR